MLAVKAGVQPQLIRILAAVANVAEKRGITLTITSGIDGRHGSNSLHYALRALDLRTHGVADVDGVMLDLSKLLGPDYDIIWEAKGTPNSHLHLEYDPS